MSWYERKSDSPLTLERLAEVVNSMLAQGAPKDLKVVVEGCDCDGDAGDVRFEGDNIAARYVYIERTRSAS